VIRRHRGAIAFVILFTVWGLQPWEPGPQGLATVPPRAPVLPVEQPEPAPALPAWAYRPSADCELELE
jgi:hypothetical protein